MQETIRLVGGPADGKVATIEAGTKFVVIPVAHYNGFGRFSYKRTGEKPKYLNSPTVFVPVP